MPQRRLTLPHAVTIGLGSMIGAGVFTALGLAAALTGGRPGLLVAALGLALVTALCNALSTAQLATVHPGSGGAYLYGRRQLHPLAGFVAGWGFVTGKTASVAAMATTLGLYLFPGDGLAARLAGVAAVVVLTAVAMAGVTRTAQATLAIVAPVVAVLLLTAVAGLALGDGGAGVSGGDVAGVVGSAPVTSVLTAAGVLFFAFAGYARIATMGEEVVDPRRTIPRAVLLALGLTAVVYALLTWGLLAALGPVGLATSDAPVREALETTLGAGWGPLALGAAALASAGAMLTLLAGVSLTALAMAREADLPRPLARVHAGSRVPRVGQAVVAAAVILLVMSTDILTIVGFSSFGVLVYYAVANLAALTLRGGADGTDAALPRPLRVPRAVNVLGLVLCLVLACTLPPLSVMAMVGVFLVGVGGRAFVIAGRER